MNRRLWTALMGVLCATALGACSHMPAGVRDAIDGSRPAASTEDRVHSAMDLLEQGEEDRAKSQLEAVLRRDPGNHTAQRLLDQINIDPQTQLGARNYAHIVREGETMSMLAERHLGDPLLFYALARYNRMAPHDLAAGQTILIPGRAPVRSASRATNASANAATASIPPPIAVAPVVNTEAIAQANRLRLQALEHLNAGDATTAVSLLQQARALDAGNVAIQRELARAQRIQASLRAQ